MKKIRYILLLCLFLTVGMLSPVFAEGEGTVTELTVGDGGDYSSVQAAIDAVSGQYAAGQQYRITVSDGSFDRFVIPHGLANITVEGSGNTVILTGAGASDTINGVAADQDPKGIVLWGADITLKNLKFQYTAGEGFPWYASAVSTHDGRAGAGAEADTQVILDGCTLEGDGNGIAFMPQRNCFTVKNCLFDGFEQAIYFACDNYYSLDTTVTDSTIKNCIYAIHGYYGGDPANAAPMVIRNNSIIGSKDRFAVIAILDQLNQGSVGLSVEGNRFEYTIVGGINFRKSGDVAQGDMASLASYNHFNKTSFLVDSFWYDAENFGTAYYAPDVDAGLATWYANPLMENGTLDGLKEKITEALAEAGTSGNVIEINAPEQETFTLSKNSVLLEGYIALSDLTITKKTVGTAETPENGFLFELSFTDENGDPLSGSYEYTDSDGTVKTFEGGTLTFRLRDGESVTVHKLLPGTQYSVKETESGGYTAEPAEGYHGTLDGDRTLEFRNTGVVNPGTSDSDWMVSVIAGVTALLLFAAVLLVRKKQG